MRPPRWNRELAIGIFVVCAGFWGSSRGADQVGGSSSRLEPLPGLVTAPRLLPGIGRWQIAHRYPSCEVYAVAWSPDGKRLAYSDLSYVRICDSQTFETQAILVGHTSRVVSIDWNRRNNRIASAGYDGRVRIWSADGAPLKQLDPHSGELHAIAWSPDGSRVASGGNDGRVRIWGSDGTAGPIINASDAPVECVAWCPDGKRLVSGDDKSLVKIWNADGSAGPVCEGHLADVTEVAWSPDGKRIASSTWGYKPPSSEMYFADVRMWNADGSPAGVLAGASANYGICWSPDSQHLAVISEDGQVRIAAPNANLESTRPLGQMMLSGCPLAWSPDGQEIAAGGTKSICVLRLSDGSTRRSPSQAATGPSTAPPPAGLPNLNFNKWLVRTAADERWQIRNADGSPGPTMPDDVLLANMTLLAWSPARDQIAFIESGLRLRLWSVGSASTKVIREFPDSITGLAWSPNGDTLAASDQSTARFVRSDGTPVFERKIDGQTLVRGPSGPSSTVR